MEFIHNVNEAFKEGGWGMWPILIASVFWIGLSIERGVYLFRSSVDKQQFMSLMQKLIAAGNVAQAIKVCSGTSKPLTRIVQAGLMRMNRTEIDVQAAMDEAALRELPRIEKRTGYLAMIGNVSTLMGLLGTITGLIKSFAGVAGVDPSAKATLLAKGISEAMNCTAFGLMVGIGALLSFSVLNGKTQGLVDDINETTVQVMNMVHGAKTGHVAQG